VTVCSRSHLVECPPYLKGHCGGVSLLPGSTR